MMYIWIEILKFFKKNFLKLVLGTALITGLFVWNNYRSNVIQLENIDNVENLDKSEGSDYVVESQPAFFQYIVEYEDGSLFSNNLLMEEYFLQEEILKEASIGTNTNLTKIIENTNNNVLVDINDYGYSKVVGVYRNDSTYINEVYINVGNERDNLKIANFYFNYLMDGKVPFVADKKRYSFVEPRILQLENETETVLETDPQSNFNLLRNVMIGGVLGVLLMISGLLSLTFISKKLKYVFSYSIREDDYCFLVDNKLDYEDELKELLLSPDTSKCVIVTEEGPSNNEQFDEIINKIEQQNIINKSYNFLNIENPSQIDRLIYIIKEDRTTRQWYNNQRKLDRFHNIPTVIIQVNKKQRTQETEN